MENMVYVVLVNYNGFDITLECIKSLKNINYKNYKIVIVDNASKDDSYEKLYKIKDKYEFILLKAENNKGFSGGNNIGIKYSIDNGADYVLLLNNDTEVDENFLKYLVEYADDKIVTISKIYYYNEPNKLWYDGGYIQKGTGVTVHCNIDKYDENADDKNVRYCTFATGCCLLIHRNILNSIGYLDEDFFMYSEDVDFSLRILEAGYKIKYVPQAKIWHKVSVSSGGGESNLSVYYTSRNRFYKMDKHRDIYGRTAYIYAFMLLIYKAVKSFLKCDGKYKYIILGFWDYLNKVKGYKEL